MKRTRPFIAALPVALAAAILTSCAPVETDESFVSEAPAARVIGESDNCISASRIRSTVVHDDRTIDFHVGNKIYRNTLPRRCPGLGFQESISYDVRGSQLCRPEIVYVLETFGNQIRRGVGCQLGEFVPVELTED